MPDWNRLSLLFSKEIEALPSEEIRGAASVILFLDWVLPDCAPAVREALDRAIKKFAAAANLAVIDEIHARNPGLHSDEVTEDLEAAQRENRGLDPENTVGAFIYG